MKFGVVVFPGTWSDKDCLHVLGPVLGHEAVALWHQDTDLQGCDAIILPGGFSYGDYLRAGAIARFAPVMGAIRSFAERGGLVLGICNGFQILLEAGILPGAMLRNESLEFRCQWVHVRFENARGGDESRHRSLLESFTSPSDGSMPSIFKPGLVSTSVIVPVEVDEPRVTSSPMVAVELLILVAPPLEDVVQLVTLPSC